MQFTCEYLRCGGDRCDVWAQDVKSVACEMMLLLVVGPLCLAWFGFILAVDPEEIQSIDPAEV